MKIAQVVATYPPRVGGMGKVAYEENVRLQQAGHEVAVFALNTAPALRWGDAGFLPTLFWRLRKFDLVHLHYPFYGSAQCVFLAKKIWGIRYVLTYHMDARPEGIVKRLAQRVYDAVWAHAILRGAEKVIVVDKNNFSRARYASAATPEKITEIVNGVDANVFAPRLAQWDDLNLSDWQDKKIILFVGNPFPLKRLDLLILACARLKQTGARLLVVGGGYDLEKYKILARKLGLGDAVRFAGACYDAEKLAKYYNAAWGVAVPSAAESFSLVAIEALACGVPVVVSGGAAGRVADGVDGMVFTSDSDADLAKKLHRLLMLSDEDRKKMGAAGRAKVLRDYTWEEHMKKLFAVYGV